MGKYHGDQKYASINLSSYDQIADNRFYYRKGLCQYGVSEQGRHLDSLSHS